MRKWLCIGCLWCSSALYSFPIQHIQAQEIVFENNHLHLRGNVVDFAKMDPSTAMRWKSY